MKKIATLIAVLGFQYLVSAQSGNLSASADKGYTPTSPVSCSIGYSEDTENFGFLDSSHVRCREIIIQSLPPITQSVTALQITFDAKGSYTFKKDAALELPENKEVYIEDMLTGMTFDLKNAVSFSFSVNRHIPERFVLHIEKSNAKNALSASIGAK